jgi:hypothetical protein
MHGNSDLPAGLEFRGNESRRGALADTGLGAGIVLLTALEGSWTALVCGALFGGSFLLSAFGQTFGELDRSVHLAFDEVGLTMPRAFHQRIPWSAITRYSFEQDDAQFDLLVHIDNPRLYEPRTEAPLATWAATWFGARLPLDWTSGDVDAIEAAFRRFAPHLRRG